MNSWVNVVLLVAAFICFVLAALGIKARIDLVSAGLACWVAATAL